MHWHDAAEWAYIVDGHCQVTVADAEGQIEVVNLGPGDLWYFPKGHGHAIQTLGPSPCHAILAFDDGLYSEHGTFGISDWMSRYEPQVLSQAFGVSSEAFAQIPKAETYIMQGDVLPLDGPQARTARALDRERTHRYALMAQKPKDQHRRRHPLRGIGKGISGVDDDDGNGAAIESAARCMSRTGTPTPMSGTMC